jgi:hypothetical protein
VELFEREGTELLDAKEHPERDGQLYEWQQEHRQYTHAGLLIHTALLERDALHGDLVACPVRLVELLLEFE